MSPDRAESPVIASPGPAGHGGGVAAVEFTVLERPVVVEFIGPCAADLRNETVQIFRDLRPRAVGSRAADLLLDTGRATPAALLERLGQGLCTTAIEKRRGDLLMLHGGAVADLATGAAVGVVGPSGAGKSTAVSTLGRRWAYLGDEVLAVDDAGRVLPLPKPVSVVVPGRPDKAQVPAADLELVPAPTEARLVGLLFLDRRPTSAVQLETVATVDALAMLGGQVSFLGARPRPLHRLALMLGRVGGLRRVTYTECVDLEPVVDGLLRGGGS